MLSKLKSNSYFVFPMLVIITLKLVDIFGNIIENISIQKIDSLINLSISIIGILLIVLTIYLSFPKSDKILERMKKSGHNNILFKNTLTGIILNCLVILIWLLGNQNDICIYFFCGSMPNLIIFGYYIATLFNYTYL